MVLSKEIIAHILSDNDLILFSDSLADLQK